MRLRSFPVLAILVAFLALAVAGCSGGGGVALQAPAGATEGAMVVRVDFVNPDPVVVTRFPLEVEVLRVLVLDPENLDPENPEPIIPPIEVARQNGADFQEIRISGVPLGNWLVRVEGLTAQGVLLGTSEDLPVEITPGGEALVEVSRFLPVDELVNGSFETGDYEGWTLWQTNNEEANRGARPFASGDGLDSRMDYAVIQGIADDGQTLQNGESVFDFFDQLLEMVVSPGLPITCTASEGAFCQFIQQGGPSDYRMHQDLTIRAERPVLAWEMAYTNHNVAFREGAQEILVAVRDPETDEILGVPFRTQGGVPGPLSVNALVVGSPSQVLDMTTFQADLSPWIGQKVRVDFMVHVHDWYFDVTTDNFRMVPLELK